MKLAWGIAIVSALLLTQSGCRVVRAIDKRECHESQPYDRATSVPPLKIPAGLDAPDTTNALKLPALNEPAPPPRRSKDPCLDEPPPFKVTQPATRTPQA
jgi:uncharacterized lipoprotein